LTVREVSVTPLSDLVEPEATLCVSARTEDSAATTTRGKTQSFRLPVLVVSADFISFFPPSSNEMRQNIAEASLKVNVCAILFLARLLSCI
jgi:hypothetical protein